MNYRIIVLKLCIVLFFVNFATVSNVFAQNHVIMDNQTGYKDEVVTFTISVSNILSEVQSFGFNVAFDFSVLEFTSSVTGNLTKGALFFDVNLDQQGVLIIGWSNPFNPIPSGASGEIVKLTFTIKETANSNLTIFALVDGFAGWGVTSGHLIANCSDEALLENLEYGRNIFKSPIPSCNSYTSFDLLARAKELGNTIHAHCKNTPQSPFRSTYWFFGQISGDKIDHHSFGAISETEYFIDKVK